jgi:hypothetical protein
MPQARFEPQIPASERPLGSAELQALVCDIGAEGELATAVHTRAVTVTTASCSAICNASLI